MLLAKNTLKIPGIYLYINDTIPLPTVGPEQISYQSPALNSSDLSQILLAERMRVSDRTSPRLWRKTAVDPDLLAHFPGHLTFHKLPVSQGCCRELENLIVLGKAFPLALRRSPGRTGEMSRLQLTPLWRGAVPLPEHELPLLSHSPIPKGIVWKQLEIF